MHTAKRLFVVLMAVFVYGCHHSTEHSIHFYIGNLSRLKKQIDIKVSVNESAIFDSATLFSPTDPYRQYTPGKKFEDGNYTINVTADSGNLKMTQPVTLKNDLWVFVTYTHGSSGDSTLLKSSLKKIPAISSIDMAIPNPSLHIFISDSKPGSIKIDDAYTKWASDTSGLY
jgi:hypothetical protein